MSPLVSHAWICKLKSNLTDKNCFGATLCYIYPKAHESWNSCTVSFLFKGGYTKMGIMHDKFSVIPFVILRGIEGKAKIKICDVERGLRQN